MKHTKVVLLSYFWNFYHSRKTDILWTFKKIKSADREISDDTKKLRHVPAKPIITPFRLSPLSDIVKYKRILKIPDNSSHGEITKFICVESQKRWEIIRIELHY